MEWTTVTGNCDMSPICFASFGRQRWHQTLQFWAIAPTNCPTSNPDTICYLSLVLHSDEMFPVSDFLLLPWFDRIINHLLTFFVFVFESRIFSCFTSAIASSITKTHMEQWFLQLIGGIFHLNCPSTLPCCDKMIFFLFFLFADTLLLIPWQTTMLISLTSLLDYDRCIINLV